MLKAPKSCYVADDIVIPFIFERLLVFSPRFDCLPSPAELSPDVEFTEAMKFIASFFALESFCVVLPY
jgi:hypothetical protein